MFFFCKPKTIVLDAFTCDRGAILVPPAPANKFRPRWWRELDPLVDQKSSNGVDYKQGTLRKCQGFKDYYSSSNIVLPFWTSVIFESGANDYRYVDSREEGIQNIVFQEEMFRGNYLNNYTHFKMISPWLFKENSGIDFLFSQAFYNFTDPAEFLIPPGTVNYKHQHSTHIHFFSKKRGDDGMNRIELSTGQPLIHITPMTEKRVIVKPHLVSEDEYKNLKTPSLFFNNIYKRMRNV